MSTPTFDLTGKVAVVTGASRGIGAEIAKTYASHGARVVLASRKQPGLDAVAEEIHAAGGEALPVACHVAQAEAVDALFQRVDEAYGSVDILVNNAATNPYFGPLVNAPEAAYDKTFEVNCKGYFLPAQRAAERMVNQGGGSIINVSSIEGLSPSPLMGVYSMTKSAVIMLTKVLARELGASKVRANCIAPGLTETRFAQVLLDTPEIREHYLSQTPLGRQAQPEEITGVALYLASDASSYTTGAVITCDGGYSV